MMNLIFFYFIIIFYYLLVVVVVCCLRSMLFWAGPGGCVLQSPVRRASTQSGEARSSARETRAPSRNPVFMAAFLIFVACAHLVRMVWSAHTFQRMHTALRMTVPAFVYSDAQ